MAETLISLFSHYLAGVVLVFGLGLCVLLGLLIYEVKHYADMYRIHAKKKRWFWQGIKFVALNTCNVNIGKALRFIFLLSLMSFWAFPFVLGAWWQYKKE